MAGADMAGAELPIFPFDSPPELDAEPEYAELRRTDPVPKVRLAPGRRTPRDAVLAPPEPSQKRSAESPAEMAVQIERGAETSPTLLVPLGVVSCQLSVGISSLLYLRSATNKWRWWWRPQIARSPMM